MIKSNKFRNSANLNLQDAMRAKLREYSYPSAKGCWIWTHGRNSRTERPQTCYNGQGCYADEIAYKLFVGPISEGQRLTRVCDNILCINPEHGLLEPMPFKFNKSRADFINRTLLPDAIAAFIHDCVRRSTLRTDRITARDLRAVFQDYISVHPKFKSITIVPPHRFGTIFSTQFNPSHVRCAGVTYIQVILIPVPPEKGSSAK
jgi:hypothetical protein